MTLRGLSVLFAICFATGVGCSVAGEPAAAHSEQNTGSDHWFPILDRDVVSRRNPDRPQPAMLAPGDKVFVEGLLDGLWKQYMTKCGDSFVVRIFQHEHKDGKVYFFKEMKEVSQRLDVTPLSSADRLNGLEVKLGAEIAYGVSREYRSGFSPYVKQWRPWESSVSVSGAPYSYADARVEVQKINGEWTHRFTFIRSRSLVFVGLDKISSSGLAPIACTEVPK